ncbi:MAG: NYN domain-containing protein [Tissierellales bacterium]|jgi:predicted RNA-binding protein with PIN domain|nr:NYN domain-containing protein [Tissierellales bacterium]
MASKKESYLFVDGYNIINNWPELRQLSKMTLDLARERLEEYMLEYQAYMDVRVIVVYDAYKIRGAKEKIVNKSGLKIVFTQERETADRYIEKQLHKLGKDYRVKVATSDWVEQQVVLGRGGTRISARELHLQYKNMKERIEIKTQKKVSKKSEEVLLEDLIDDDLREKLNNMLKKS